MSALELKVPPAALVGILALAMWFGARLAPSFSFSFPRQSWVVAVLAAAGALITLLGDVAFRRARTTVDPRYPMKSAALGEFTTSKPASTSRTMVPTLNSSAPVA